MLKRLLIRNYAIISELDVAFGPDLTIITGETGAGKSILLGALSLVLGKRADTSMLHDETRKCVVEAYFDISGLSLDAFFAQYDLDVEDITILRREIGKNGKSRAFINDTPVNLQQLRELAAQLIDIHSQHEVLTLGSAAFRARFLDSCADGGNSYRSYAVAFSRWSDLAKEVSQLKEDRDRAVADQDYIEFQLNELDALELKPGQLQQDQDQLNALEHAEDIQSTVGQIIGLLSQNEDAVVDALRAMDAQLARLQRHFQAAANWRERITSAMIDLEDLTEEMEQKTAQVEQDPESMRLLQERVDEVQRLLTKHRKQTDEELIQLRDELQEQIASISDSDEHLTMKQGELEQAESELVSLSKTLTEQRKKTAAAVAPRIEQMLHGLGMPDTKMEIVLSEQDRSVLGSDHIQIRFSANKGQALQDISKVASGGELSRLMLAVKSIMAEHTRLPAIIFDEIDTGVSGEVADKVGKQIRALSGNMQVICITHLPQIASKADVHLFVFKEEREGRTVTSMRRLDGEERITEVAKMLSNADPTDAALTHARTMVEQRQ